MVRNYDWERRLKRGLVTVDEYVENIAEGKGWDVNKIMPAKQRREVDKMRKEAEAMQKFNGVNIMDAFQEAIDCGAQNYEEALQMVIEGNLLFGSIPGRFNQRNEIELYRYGYVFEIIEEEFGAEVWFHVSPTDNGAVVDLATEAEARRHAQLFYDLAY